LTSSSYPADLGGLRGADDKCQAHAEEASLPGTYKAWLSDSYLSPSNRFRCRQASCSSRGYKLANEHPIASDWDALTSGTLEAAIEITEFGVSPLGGTPSVWTNTQIDGTPTGDTSQSCSNWTSTTGSNAALGFYQANDSHWTASTTSSSCAGQLQFYCFQQE
jgi:hypothetical protein